MRTRGVGRAYRDTPPLQLLVRYGTATIPWEQVQKLEYNPRSGRLTVHTVDGRVTRSEPMREP